MLDVGELAGYRHKSNGLCTMSDAVLANAGTIATPLEVPLDGETLVIVVAGLSPRIRAAEAATVRELKRCVACILQDGGPRGA